MNGVVILDAGGWGCARRGLVLCWPAAVKMDRLIPLPNFMTTGRTKGKYKEVASVSASYRTHPSHRCLSTICGWFVWALTGAWSPERGGAPAQGGEKCRRQRSVNQKCNEFSFGASLLRRQRRCKQRRCVSLCLSQILRWWVCKEEIGVDGSLLWLRASQTDSPRTTIAK